MFFQYNSPSAIPVLLALYRTTMNTLIPWLSTYSESLIPGCFTLGFDAGRETDEQQLSTEARHWTSAGPSDTRRADADAESSATCNMRTETGLMQQKQEEDACHSAMAPSATDAAMVGMSGCFSLQNPSFYLALAFTTASMPIPTCGLLRILNGTARELRPSPDHTYILTMRQPIQATQATQALRSRQFPKRFTSTSSQIYQPQTDDEPQLD
ncbi:hypothetical protein CNYM01_02900 [Colletotrichum nymphaeae SA-01]|uniref:Uncharacterized protein n=1 Tax=Colletotrichum nymphaeae SA-01 TaxID=1460502 RepID=A0A135S1U0_9PEZI|nr:hypothetical protein CNYM01_02900 [Colletotrichum nymphaeae SA-01]